MKSSRALTTFLAFHWYVIPLVNFLAIQLDRVISGTWLLPKDSEFTALWRPFDYIGASARPMVMISGFYGSHGPSPSGDACGIVLAHPHCHWNGQQSWHILHCCFVFCRPGGHRGNTEQVVARWRCLSRGFYESPGPPPSGDARGITPCTITPPWLSKWPATEVHSFGVAASFIWSNIAKRPCYGQFNLMPSDYINLIGFISLCVSYWRTPTRMYSF